VDEFTRFDKLRNYCMTNNTPSLQRNAGWGIKFMYKMPLIAKNKGNYNWR
jgi:hypothetical protein